MTKYNPAMLTLARESRALTQTDLAMKFGVPQGTISKLESGALAFTEEYAKSASRALDYPVSFFSQTDPVYPFGSSTFYHRRLQSVPASTLRQLEAKINIYRMHVVRLLRATDLHARCMFRRIDLDERRGNVEDVAGLVRSAWHIPRGPVPNVVRAIEDAGGIVIRFSFGTAKMFGLSEWIPPAPPMFFLNEHPDISADRDRFTLAHELGHVILHAFPSPEMEAEADRFAAEFLMPADDIRPHLTPPVKLHTAARLKPIWKVSMAAIIRRAKELGIINDNQYTYLRIQLQQKGYRMHEPRELDIAREQPSLLPEIIRAHAYDLGYSPDDFEGLVNIYSHEFRLYYPPQQGRLRVVGE